MLQHLSNFILKSTVRSYQYLLSPKVLDKQSYSFPRFSVYHYLDTNSDYRFIPQDLSLINSIPKTKRIPISHIADLDKKDEVLVLRNKILSKEIKDFNRRHIDRFRVTDYSTYSFNDPNVFYIFNYNAIKDLYSYRGSLVAPYYEKYNLYYTLFNNINTAIKQKPDTVHFVDVNIPNFIPSFVVANIIIKFNLVKYSKIVKEHDLFLIFEIYKWLSDNKQAPSSLDLVEEQNLNKLYFRFIYKDYCATVNAALLYSLKKTSSLPSKLKLQEQRVLKLFLFLLLKIQKTIEDIYNSEKEKTEEPTAEIEDSEDLTDENSVNIQDTTELLDEKQNTAKPDYLSKAQNTTFIQSNKQKPPKSEEELLNKKELDIEQFLKTIDEDLDSLNKQNDIFLSKLSELEKKQPLEQKEQKEESAKKSELPVKQETKEQLETISLYNEEKLEQNTKEATIEEIAKSYTDEALKYAIISSSEARAINEAIEANKNLKSPYNKKQSIYSYTKIEEKERTIEKEDVKLQYNNPIVEEDFKQDNINTITSKYIQNTLKKDIVATLLDLQKEGIIIKDYEVEDVSLVTGKYEIHKLTLKPLGYRDSTIYFRIPKIDKDGDMLISGIKVFMRKQRTDLPIRKIAPTKVALLSSYGKLFVNLTSRKTNNTHEYIVSYIRSQFLNQPSDITELYPGKSYNNTVKLPNTLNYLSMHFDKFTYKNYKFICNTKAINQYLDEATIKELKNKSLYFIGYLDDKDILVIDNNDVIHNYSKNSHIGTIEQILGLNLSKIPQSYSTLKVLGQDIPLAAVLGYYIGLDGIVTKFKTKYSTVKSVSTLELKPKDVVLRFKYTYLVLHCSTEQEKSIYAGFKYYKDTIKNYNLEEFFSKDIYYTLLQEHSSAQYLVTELNLLKNLFIDSITKDVLAQINEPQDFINLLFRANELLQDYSHPDINDARYSRIRHYDRIPSLIYRALVEEVRVLKNKPSSAKLSIDPYKVWNYITRDNTIKIAEDNNPIMDLKEKEIVTITGIDGLNKDAINNNLRRYHPSDMGLISEATVDSGDVSVNTYLTPYAKITNTRGLISSQDVDYSEKPHELFSTSVLLSPAAEHDDPKRINFINIQNSHTIATIGYTQPILRTEYEYTIPYRVSSMYCNYAKEDGVVVKKTKNTLTVQYNNNTTETIPIGAKFGRLEGEVFKHVLETDYDAGDKFKKYDILSYNTSFFEKDWLNPNSVIFKTNTLATVALSNSTETFEDSSAISQEFASKVATTRVEERKFVFAVNKNIINLLPVGTEVTPDTVLFTVLEENIDYINLTDAAIATLQNLSSISPKAKLNGKIIKYEIKYNCELQDMSNTFKNLAIELNKQTKEETLGTEYEIDNNQVDIEYRVDGKNLNRGYLELKVFIEHDLNMGVGDKGVFAHQMKSVVSSVFKEKIVTESGDKIDALFSYKGILNRIVYSTILIGTTNRLLIKASELAAKEYFE